jgi:hypothetical protein
MPIVHDVFRGDDSGGPVDYTAPLGTTSSLSYTPPPIAPGATVRYGVRSRDTGTGLVDRNTDAQALVVVAPDGTDRSAAPAPPVAVRATATKGGTARVEWSWPGPGTPPQGFHVYTGPPGAVDLDRPAAAVPVPRGAGPGHYRATLAGLAHGAARDVVVRAWNAAGEESNTSAARLVADAAAPGSAVAVVATPVAGG